MLIVTLAAFVVDQVSVVLSPLVIDVSFAENELITGGGTTVTVTSLDVLLAEASVAVMVYVVVVAGETVVLPSRLTDPIPGDMLTDTAFVVAQDNVELPPVVIVEGEAVKESTNCMTVTVTVADTPRPLAASPVSVNVVVEFTVTVVDPSRATLPTPGEMLTEFTLLVAQVRVTVPEP